MSDARADYLYQTRTLKGVTCHCSDPLADLFPQITENKELVWKESELCSLIQINSSPSPALFILLRAFLLLILP